MKNQILFVDDEPQFLDGVRRTLHNREDIWDMWFAQSVDEAMEKVYEHNVDMIIADINMPGKDGFQLLEILNASESTKDIPVVILTGIADHSLKRRALEQGAADLLNKPVILEDLLARIHSVLRLKSYQDRLKEHNRILEKEVKERTAELEKSRLDVILRLGKAAEYHDEETGNHILRVGCYSRILAEQLQMDHELVELIFLASPLHDIGKIGIPDHILLKKGKLTPSERQMMQRHCIIGAEILLKHPTGMNKLMEWRRVSSGMQFGLRDNRLLKMASTIALSHHEKWDGTGYPEGLHEEDIPLAGRIVTLADQYDALRSVRPYKPAFSEDETLSILREEAPRCFDPRVFAVFECSIGIFNSIYETFADNQTQNETICRAAREEVFSGTSCTLV